MPAIKEPTTRTYFPDNKTSFGKHQAYHILPYTIDRTNLFVGKVELHVYEPWNEPDLKYLDLDYGTNQVGSDSGIKEMGQSVGKGFPTCVGIERRYDEGNSMSIYTYTFEGIATKHSQKYKEYELEFTMEQAPIETHPKFQEMNDKYGPYDSLNRTWPPIVTEAAAATGLEHPSEGGPVTNPLYGITSYVVPGCIYRVTYTNPDVSQAFLGDMGKVTDKPQVDDNDNVGNIMQNFGEMINKPGEDRNWLKMAPKVRQHGGCITITEEWQLSGPRGWIAPVYEGSE